MHALKKVIFQSPGRYIAAVILAAAAGMFRYFTLPEAAGIRFAWYEILSVSGYVTFLVGGLLTVAYLGAFDLFGYVFSPGRTDTNRKYRDYADYSEKKAASRARSGYYFVPFYVVGAVLIIVSLFIF